MTSKHRINLADFLKGLAVLFMIQVHIMELWTSTAVAESWIGKLSFFLGGPPAAPLFMMIMGYFVAQGKSVKKTALRGLQVIFWGLFLNIGLNANLLYHIYFEGWAYDPLTYILGVDIFYLAGLSLIILALLKPLREIKWLFPILIILIGIISIPIARIIPTNNSSDYLLAFIGGQFHWSYFPLFPWLAYSLVGYSIFLYRNFIFRMPKMIYVLMFLISAIAMFYAWPIATNLSLYYHHSILFILWTTLFLGSWAYFLQLKIDRLDHFKSIGFIKRLGRYVTPIYVIQWLIIGNLATEIYQTLNLLQTLLAIPIVILLSNLILEAYLFLRIKKKKQLKL